MTTPAGATLIANESALTSYEASGGVAYYENSNGDLEQYVPGVSDLPSGTALYEAPAEQATTTPGYQGEPLGPGTPVITGPPATTTSGSSSSSGSSGGGGGSVSVVVPSSGESVPIVESITPDELSTMLDGIISGFAPEQPQTTSYQGPASTTGGAACEGAWTQLCTTFTSDVPNHIDSFNQLATQSL